MLGFLKALTNVRHVARAPFSLILQARTKFDYAKEVGDGLDASVVMAPVNWVQRAIPEARFRVMREGPDGDEEIDRHPLTELIRNPNPFYSDEALWAATALSYLTAGNAYWLVAGAATGRPAELWYTPHWTIAPRWPTDGSDFISGYLYKPGGGAEIRLEIEDVVHFRHGLDPRNPRLGLSPLNGVLREIFVDLEGSNFVAALVRNLGVAGMVVSPESGVAPSPEDLEATKKWLMESFTGDRRGMPLVMGAATKVSEYGFDPKKMDLASIRDVAEERVCAALGIPAAVVGFGAGLQTAKVGATMNELRRLAWTNGVIPILRAFAGEVERSLLDRFTPAQAGVHAEWDTSDVAALADERLAASSAWSAMIAAGWAEVSEGRQALGLDVDDTHRIFLRPFSAIEVPAGQAPRQPPEAPAAGGPPPAEEEEEEEESALDLPAWKAAKQRRQRRTAGMIAYVAALERMERPLGRAMSGRLEPFFAALGRAAAAAARPLLADDAVVRQAHHEDLIPQARRSLILSLSKDATKQTADDELLTGHILEGLGLAASQTAFQRLYEAHYLETAKEVSKAGRLIGLATDLPDPVARAVLAAGGRRSGLVDLTEQSRQAVFDALAEGHAAGEGVEQLAARIAGEVEAGPWGSAETRARTIARSETKFAQNISTIERARHEGVTRYMIFDGRFGEPRSLASHVARDGTIVSADEASRLAAEEHPNGTLSFSPVFEEESEGG